jgi:hypothetical protein
MEVSGQHQHSAALPSGKRRHYPFDRRLGGYHSRSRRCRVRIICYLAWNRTPANQAIARHYTDWAILVHVYSLVDEWFHGYNVIVSSNICPKCRWWYALYLRKISYTSGPQFLCRSRNNCIYVSYRCQPNRNDIYLLQTRTGGSRNFFETKKWLVITECVCVCVCVCVLNNCGPRTSHSALIVKSVRSVSSNPERR